MSDNRYRLLQLTHHKAVYYREKAEQAWQHPGTNTTSNPAVNGGRRHLQRHTTVLHGESSNPHNGVSQNINDMQACKFLFNLVMRPCA